MDLIVTEMLTPQQKNPLDFADANFKLPCLAQ